MKSYEFSYLFILIDVISIEPIALSEAKKKQTNLNHKSISANSIFFGFSREKNPYKISVIFSFMFFFFSILIMKPTVWPSFINEIQKLIEMKINWIMKLNKPV